MQKRVSFFITCLVAMNVTAQPFLDVANIRFTRAFHIKKSNATPFSYLYISHDLPFKIPFESFIKFSHIIN